MLEYLNPKSALRKLGVTSDECDELNHNEAIQYLFFHQKKNWQKFGINFVGFYDDELSELHRTADKNSLVIFKNFTPDVKLICIGTHTNYKRIEKAKNDCPMVLSGEEFLNFFSDVHYSLKSAKIIFDNLIPAPFRIAKPLSNFDLDVVVTSYGQSDNKLYMTNLHKMTCTCPEFLNSKKRSYPVGDLAGFASIRCDCIKKASAFMI